MTISNFSTPPILTDYDDEAIHLLDQNLLLNFPETGRIPMWFFTRLTRCRSSKTSDEKIGVGRWEEHERIIRFTRPIFRLYHRFRYRVSSLKFEFHFWRQNEDILDSIRYYTAAVVPLLQTVKRFLAPKSGPEVVHNYFIYHTKWIILFLW